MPENIPDDVIQLKKYIDQLIDEVKLKDKRITHLEEIIGEFKRQLFGTKSEKFDPNDALNGRLFNEAELGLSDPPELFDGHSETVHVKSFIRKKSGRKALPNHLPRQEIIHDIEESEKICNCGSELIRIGEETSEKLSIIPQQVYVDALFRNHSSILHAGCIAHARREFERVWKSGKDPKAKEGLYIIRELYKVEAEIREAKFYEQGLFSEIAKIRQTKSKPLMDKLYDFLKRNSALFPKTVGVGRAISYTLGQWEKLNLYLSYGEIHIDNNLVENAIRPFVVGRKNWLFSGCPEGAEASSFWFSFLETAKANGKEPYKVLLEFLKGLPFCKSSSNAETLFYKCMGWV